MFEGVDREGSYYAENSMFMLLQCVCKQCDLNVSS